MIESFRVPRVKVCGLTSAEDVELALAAGADALGFVHFAPSPRSLAAEDAARLVALVPPGVLAVGVLVSAHPLDALAFAETSGVRALQLCGRERPADWQAFPLPLLRRVAVEERAEEHVEAWREVARVFVLDHPAAPGGSGLAVMRHVAATLAERAPCLLAGGLDAHNVAAAVRAVRPAGVDASSRLECAPGRKDPDRVRAFVRAALGALREVQVTRGVER